MENVVYGFVSVAEQRVAQSGLAGEVERRPLLERLGLDPNRCENVAASLAAVRAERSPLIEHTLASDALLCHPENDTGLFPPRCSNVGHMKLTAAMKVRYPDVDWDAVLATPPAPADECRRALLEAGADPAVVEAGYPVLTLSA